MGFSWFRLGGKIGRNEYPPLVRPVSEELNIRLFSGSRLHLRVIISARIRARDNSSVGSLFRRLSVLQIRLRF